MQQNLHSVSFQTRRLAGLAAPALAIVLVALGATPAAAASEDATSSGEFKESDGPLGAGLEALQLRGEFGDGLIFTTADEHFYLQLRARAQIQALFEGDDDIERAAFLVRRMRLLLRGHVLDGLIAFYFQLGFAERDLEADQRVPLRDARVTLNLVPWFNVTIGQMKVPFDHQRVTSSSKLQLVERARVVNALNLDRDIGLKVHGEIEPIAVEYNLGVFAGEGRNRFNPDLGLLYMGRLRWSPLGGGTGSDETDVTREPRLRMTVDGALGWNHRSHRLGSTQGAFWGQGSVDYLHAASHLSIKYAGWSLGAEFLFREAMRFRGGLGTLAAAGDESPSERGAFVQTGYLFEYPIEVAARVGWLQSFGRFSKGEEELELTGGVNWLVIDHDLKLQVNYTAVVYPAMVEHAVRVQAQVYF